MSAVATDIASLYVDHHHWLQQWLRRRLGNAFDAADIAHDTYLRLMVAETTPPIQEPRRYLCRIANGLAIDLVRRRQIESAYLDALAARPAAFAPSEEERAIAIQALLEVDMILNKLSPKARSALLMFRLDGKSYRDIAKTLQVSVSSVEKYIAQGMAACLRAAHIG
ncbi:sigma-70 family RNA polymerase sigma factor [Lampropedia puyangensis]|uniref:Sigma-70 family RNA polymerase sigma factor n=1 Tax=Lampropedia puyangensis TaxID=1330072 RepID=A0A4S8FGV4_9BURK|nr:sigma-70 family RNA polymerase sigma factor [Lampropedia puyangensis]THU05082.1 sigma-70 family RNA polymerase sigma factor [Lampropedia puyangensis]